MLLIIPSSMAEGTKLIAFTFAHLFLRHTVREGGTGLSVLSQNHTNPAIGIWPGPCPLGPHQQSQRFEQTQHKVQ